MKKFMLCLLALFLVTGCNEKEKEQANENDNTTPSTEQKENEDSKVKLEDVNKLFVNYYKYSNDKSCGIWIPLILDSFEIEHSSLEVSESGNVNSEFKKYIQSKNDVGGENKVVYSFKYADFKNNILKSMTEELFNKYFPSDIFYSDSNGNLATTENYSCGSGEFFGISHINVIETENGYRAILFLTGYENENISVVQYDFTIKNVDNNLVIDKISDYDGALDSKSQEIYDNFKAYFEYKDTHDVDYYALTYEDGKYYAITADENGYYKQAYTTKNLNGQLVVDSVSTPSRTDNNYIIGNHLPLM